MDGLCGDLPASRIRLRNLDDGRTQAMRCKLWGCRECGPWLKRRLRRSIAAACNARPDLRRFFTLTLPGEWHPTRLAGGRRVPNPAWNGQDTAAAYAFMAAAWTKFAKRVERHFGRRLSYGTVKEPHADGTPHFHGLVDAYIPHAKLAQFWAEVGGGYCDIRLVDTHRVSAYLSKYLSKDGQAPPRGHRKYATGGGVRFENVRPPRPPPQPRLRPAASRPEWVVEAVGPGGRWTIPWDAGPAIGGVQRAPDIARRAWKVRPSPPAPRCGCGAAARLCWSCEGPHCRACRGGSSTCWANR